MTSLTGWLLLLVATAANAAANLLIKRSAMEVPGMGLAQYTAPAFIAALVLFGFSVLVYAKALQSIPVSIAYPILVGLGMLLVVALSVPLLKESPSAHQLAGMALLLAGVYLMWR
jgi:undecaprenyl phosphate-alpha-L-ara4N flippase subunit ArnE